MKSHSEKNKQPNQMKTRITITIMLFLITVASGAIINLYWSPLTGVATAAQFDDTANSYAFAKFLRDNAQSMLTAIFFLLTALLWIRPIRNYINKRHIALLLMFSAIIALSSCAPYKTLDVVEVKSNETAWAIPLDAMAQNGQVKFNSVDFLNQKKVAAKRIMVDKIKRSTGRTWLNIEWLPAVRVIKVDRSLVTRQWTDGNIGTSKDDEGIGVVTKDSVKLRVGLTVTASIDEDDASAYLYYHGQDRTLAQVLDQNVRSFAVAELTKEYSMVTLNEAQMQGEAIYAKLFSDAAKVFKAKGVTIQYLGNAEGLTYADPSVQGAINARYLAEQDVKTAAQQQEAQKIRNATTVLNAQAQADAAKKLLEAKEATAFQNELNIKLLNAQANMKMAERWTGVMPTSILPSNSPLLMNLGR